MSGDDGDRKRADAELRRRAELAVAARGSMEESFSREHLAELLHELEVHQVELEMQNESLRLAQAELEHSRDAYADLYDFAPIGYVTLDQMGIVREANLTMAELLGVDRARLIGHPMVAFVNHGGKNGFLRYLQRCREARAGESLVAEANVKSQRRGETPVQLRTTVAGQPGTCRCSYRMAVMDISEHRRDEARARELARFPEENPNPVMRARPDGTLIYANPASSVLLELLDCRIGDRLPAVLREQVARSASVHSRAEFDMELGDITYAMAVSPGAGGVDVNLYARDITGRKRAEQALRESRGDLNRAQAVAHVGSWRLDVRRNELVWSDENHRIFGLPVGTPMSYETFLSYVHPDDRAYVDERWKAALAGEPYDVEHRIIADNCVKWVRERAELEFDEDGSLRGGFGTTQDVTEKKCAEHALRTLNETLEQKVAQRTATLEMLHDVASIASVAASAEETLENCLRRVARQEGWSFGHVLVPSADDPDLLVSSLVCFAAEGARYREFREASLAATVRRGHGVAGRAYGAGGAVATTDLGAELDPRRARLAEGLGLIAGAAFPVMAEHTVIGVVEFFSERSVTLGRTVRTSMLDVGMQIGRVLERKAFQDRLLTLAEEEHRRIGQELHDDVGQELAGLALQMETLAEMLGRRNDETAVLARKIVDVTDRARRKCRAVSRGLLPVEMIPSELGPALADLAARTQANYDISCRFACAGQGPVANNRTATQLYRIAREAVANAVTHGQARNVEIALAIDERETVLTVRDDGTGLRRRNEHGPGMGMRIMRYRADLIGGRLEIASPEAGGTTVICRLPTPSEVAVDHGTSERCSDRAGIDRHKAAADEVDSR